MKMRAWSKRAVVSLFLCITFSSPSLQLNQDFENSSAARNLKQVGEYGHEVHCSREWSRVAWSIIDEYLMPFVEKERYQISPKCRLHPDNDLYRDQEQHKLYVYEDEWGCGYCKKKFYAEKYLDMHFDNRHYNLLNVSTGRCMADICGALHCDLMLDPMVGKAKCNPAAAARNRHLCESLANSCFPVNECPSASRLHEFFLRQFCDAHTCTGKQNPFPKGRRKQTNMTYVTISILILILLPLFYVFVYLYQRGLKRGIQGLKGISQSGQKKKTY